MRKCCSVKWKYHKQYIIVACTHIFQQLIIAKWNTAENRMPADVDRWNSLPGSWQYHRRIETQLNYPQRYTCWNYQERRQL